MKVIVGYLKEVGIRYLEIFWPTKNSFEGIESIKGKAVQFFLLISGIYIILYVLVYAIKFDKFQKYNEDVITKLEAKGSGTLLKWVNTYPGNLLYILLSFGILLILLYFSIVLLTRILEVDKRSLKDTFFIVFRSLCAAYSVFPIILLINSILPIGKDMNAFMAVLMVLIWSALALISFIVSARCFILINSKTYSQPRRRSLVIWSIPYLFLLNFIYGIIFK